MQNTRASVRRKNVDAAARPHALTQQVVEIGQRHAGVQAAVDDHLPEPEAGHERPVTDRAVGQERAVGPVQPVQTGRVRSDRRAPGGPEPRPRVGGERVDGRPPDASPGRVVRGHSVRGGPADVGRGSAALGRGGRPGPTAPGRRESRRAGATADGRLVRGDGRGRRPVEHVLPEPQVATVWPPAVGQHDVARAVQRVVRPAAAHRGAGLRRMEHAQTYGDDGKNDENVKRSRDDVTTWRSRVAGRGVLPSSTE